MPRRLAVAKHAGGFDSVGWTLLGFLLGASLAVFALLHADIHGMIRPFAPPPACLATARRRGIAKVSVRTGRVRRLASGAVDSARLAAWPHDTPGAGAPEGHVARHANRPPSAGRRRKSGSSAAGDQGVGAAASLETVSPEHLSHSPVS